MSITRGVFAQSPEQEAHDKVLDNNPDRIGILIEILVFEEKGKPEYPEKNLSEQGQEPTTASTHIQYDADYIGGRRVLSPLRHPCSLMLERCQGVLLGITLLGTP